MQKFMKSFMAENSKNQEQGSQNDNPGKKYDLFNYALCLIIKGKELLDMLENELATLKDTNPELSEKLGRMGKATHQLSMLQNNDPVDQGGAIKTPTARNSKAHKMRSTSKEDHAESRLDVYAEHQIDAKPVDPISDLPSSDKLKQWQEFIAPDETSPGRKKGKRPIQSNYKPK